MPADDLSSYVGELTSFHTGETFEWRAEYLHEDVYKRQTLSRVEHCLQTECYRKFHQMESVSKSCIRPKGLQLFGTNDSLAVI